MKKNTKTKYIFGSTLFFVAVFFAALFFYLRYLDVPKGSQILGSTNFISNINGEEKKFSVQKLQNKDGETVFRLLLHSNIFSSSSIYLTGFEENVSKCAGSEFTDLLCFTGDVGVHSQNIQFIKVANRVLKYVYFVDKESMVINNASDWPDIIAKDYNSDGYVDIIIVNRDYLLDPLQDGVKNYYMRVGDNLVFDRSEEFKYY